MSHTRSSLLFGGLLVLSLGMSACGAGEPASESETGEEASSSSTPHGYVEGAEEASEPQLRLAVQDGESGGLKILDLLTEETVAEEEGSPQAHLSAADNRYLFETDAEDGKARVFDSGVWTVDHGDHYHYYRSDASEVGEVSGEKPGHVVSNDSSVAFFFDGDGSAKVYDRKAMEDGELEETGTVASGAHHGVAAPLNDHLISTTPQDDSSELPNELALYDESGSPADLTGQADCEQIHGAGATRDAAAFACDDGVITVDEDFNAELRPYPEEASGRAWSLSTGKKLMAAPLEDSGLGVLDPSTGEWVYASTDAEIITAGVSPDDKTVLALDADGVGYSIDPATGEVLTSRKLVDVPEDADEESSPGPTVAVDRERAYVSDPAGGRVLEIDVADGLREARSLDVGGAPSSIAVTGR
ncbi:YncE family protein [Rothia halotolerans]|uniref:YncE family protein n=1 Tax=Rothia halotolerans TaxID=405770 RepID=UPI00101DC4E6|nr:hypothetical protein [Rothia halotolerans]